MQRVTRDDVVVTDDVCSTNSGVHRTFRCAVNRLEGFVYREYGNRTNLQREIEIHAFLKHENHAENLRWLVQDRRNETCGLIFDYMPKGSVGDYIFGDKQHGYKKVCTPQNILKWFKQLAALMSRCHAHDQPIIHRRITPYKMLLTEDSAIRLSDFSASRETNQENMTNNVGSYMYKAPEVIEEGQAYNSKCDVYSFGMALYACTNKERKTPFQDESAANDGIRFKRKALLAYLKEGNRPTIPVSEIFEPDQRERLQRLIGKCWAQDPANRPTMEEVFTELQAIAQNG